MIRRRALPALAPFLLAAGCTAQPGDPHYARHEGGWWLGVAFGLFGLAFPHLASAGFLDDARIVRMLAASLLLLSAGLLASLYLF